MTKPIKIERVWIVRPPEPANFKQGDPIFSDDELIGAVLAILNIRSVAQLVDLIITTELPPFIEPNMLLLMPNALYRSNEAMTENCDKFTQVVAYNDFIRRGCNGRILTLFAAFGGEDNRTQVRFGTFAKDSDGKITNHIRSRRELLLAT